MSWWSILSANDIDHFSVRVIDPTRGEEEGSKSNVPGSKPKAVRYPEQPECICAGSPVDGVVLEEGAVEVVGRALAPPAPQSEDSADGRRGAPSLPNCVYRDDLHGIWLYQGNCLTILDAIAAKHPEGCYL